MITNYSGYRNNVFVGKAVVEVADTVITFTVFPDATVAAPGKQLAILFDRRTAAGLQNQAVNGADYDPTTGIITVTLDTVVAGDVVTVMASVIE